jgi:hypothetical protein
MVIGRIAENVILSQIGFSFIELKKTLFLLNETVHIRICSDKLYFFTFFHSFKEKINDLFKEYDNQNSPGAAVVIVKNGEIFYKKEYGIRLLAPVFPHNNVTCLLYI